MAAGPQKPARRSDLGFAAIFAALLAFAVLVPDVALAQSRVCRQLEAELTSGGGASTSRSRRTEAAIARQRDQLQLAKSQARSAGCGFRIFKSGSGACAAYDQKIGRMERNLASLESRGTRTAKPQRSRAQIMAALRANGCRDDAVAGRRPARGLDGPRNLLDQIFGGGVRQRGTLDDLGAPVRRDEGQQARRITREPEGGWVNEGGRIRFSAPPGRYRTLCVRTCDGYYFPVSNMSSPSDFERDQANCQSSCPGTEVQLYYHRSSQESEAMRSGISGRPYDDLPTAWLYKQTGVPTPAGCACGIPKPNEASNFSVIAGNPPAEQPVAAEPESPQPATRPDPGLDPETQANLDGGLDAEALKRMANTPRVSKSSPPGEERRVRVVGPVFLPDPEVAADPQAPARTEVR
ncbi:MAG: DUF2865 domain-containing protein [Mesorhizobium sp.]|nr:DUF2865 domain-containing protein [Mesorhizobium sp.]MBL8578829.1 DUF2865 domain-containing protein [Mesorhizobium sp.]